MWCQIISYTYKQQKYEGNFFFYRYNFFPDFKVSRSNEYILEVSSSFPFFFFISSPLQSRTNVSSRLHLRELRSPFNKSFSKRLKAAFPGWSLSIRRPIIAWYSIPIFHRETLKHFWECSFENPSCLILEDCFDLHGNADPECSTLKGGMILYLFHKEPSYEA